MATVGSETDLASHDGAGSRFSGLTSNHWVVIFAVIAIVGLFVIGKVFKGA